MAGERVLIIDASEQDVYALVEGLLRPENLQIEQVRYAELGLHQILNNPPDLIIADFATQAQIDPPLLSQLERAHSRIPIILTGVSSAPEIYRLALRMGLVDYLLKPIRMGEARVALRRALAPPEGSRPELDEAHLPPSYDSLNRQLSRRVRELSILLNLGRAVNSVEDLEELLNRIVEAAVYMTQAEEGFILLLDPESRELYLRAGKGLGEKFAKGFRVRSSDSMLWQVVESGEPFVVANAAEKEQFKIKTGYLVNVLLHVPLKLRGQVIGVLSVDNRVASRDFDQNDLRLLTALADYAAIAIANMQQAERAHEETDRLAEVLEARDEALPADPDQQAPRLARRVQELSLLHDIGRAVTSVRDLEKLLIRIVEAAVYVTRAEEGFILLLDQESGELYLRAGQGLGKKFATGFRVKSRDSVVWQVIDTGEPVLMNADQDDGLKIKTGYLARAMLHVPLKLRDQVIGVLSVNNVTVEHPFAENDQNLLAVLADYAAIALDNVQQIQRAEAEISRFAELLSTQTMQPPPPPNQLPVEAVPLEWLLKELQNQQDVAREGREQSERLASTMASQVQAVENLAAAWRAQQAEVEEMAQRIAIAGLASVDGNGESLIATLADLRGTLDNLGAGLLVTSRWGIVTTANSAAAHILHNQQLVGRNLRDLSPSTHWVQSVDRLENQRGRSATMWEEITFWSKGRLIKAVLLPYSEEGDVGWTVILRDLFRERAVRLTLEDLTAEVSQELRTPLTILSNYTDLLMAETVGLLVPAQQRLLSRMRSSLDRMSGTLNQTLERVIPLDKEGDPIPPADFSMIFQSALNHANRWFTAKKLELRLELEEDLPQVAAQSDCIYQMLVNLFQNAARATPTGGTVSIAVRVDRGGESDAHRPHVAISVQDQGGGIPSELLGQVFDRYYSKDAQPIPGLGGQGAELSAVKTLVEAFGGRVWAESTPGRGSTFSFILPAINGHV